jgi:hypothetical protein
MKTPEKDRQLEKLEEAEIDHSQLCQGSPRRQCQNTATWRRSVLSSGQFGSLGCRSVVICDKHAEKYATRVKFDGSTFDIDIVVDGKVVPNPWVSSLSG